MTKDHHQEFRNRRAWLLWVTGIILAVALALMINSYASRDNLLAGCERNNTLKQQLVNFMTAASDARRDLADRATTRQERISNMRTSAKYSLQAAEVRRTIVDCESAYPPLIPWIS